MAAEQEEGESESLSLTNPAVDVRTPHEHWQGYDVEPGTSPGSNPVFQLKQTGDRESWILRWSSPRRPSDSELNLRREFGFAVKTLGLTDFEESSWQNSTPGAYIETPEDSGYFEGSQIASLQGALNSGFSIDEALEKNERSSTHQDSHYFRIADPSRWIVYEVEVADDAILKGVQGYSPFREEDMGFMRGVSEDEYRELVADARRKTAHLGSASE